MEGLAVAHPARAAAGDEGQRAALFHPAQKFGGFFHDGHIGGKVGVEHAGKAHAAQRGHHFALHVGADGIPKLFAQGRAHAGGGLHNHVAGGVAQSLPHLAGVVALYQSAGGAHVDALAAADAGGIGQLALEGAGDMGVEAPLHHVDDPHALVLGAGGDAAAADDALGVILYQVKGAVVVLLLGQYALKAVGFIDPVLLAQAQQLAVAAAHAAHAVLVVGGEDELQVGLAGGLHLGGVGEHLHALADRVHTGGQQAFGTLYLHHAHTAGAVYALDLLQVAKGGDGDADLVGGLQHGGARRRLTGHIVDL